MDRFDDALSRRVGELAKDARRFFQANRHMKSLLVYAVGGHEHRAMLDVLPLADSRIRRGYAGLAAATADILAMPVEVLGARVAADLFRAKSEQAVGRRWTRRLLWRLRGLRPTFCVFICELVTVIAQDLAKVTETKRLAGQYGLPIHPESRVVVGIIGLNPIRCYAHLIPIIMSPDGAYAGEAEVRDSMRGDGYVGGLFGSIYLPCRS